MPPPPPDELAGGDAPQRRYEGGIVALAAVLTVVGTIGVTLLVPPLVLAVPVLLVAAIVMTVRSRELRPRSLWMGVLVGCGFALVVGGGLCVALIAGLDSA